MIINTVEDVKAATRETMLAEDTWVNYDKMHGDMSVMLHERIDELVPELPDAIVVSGLDYDCLVPPEDNRGFKTINALQSPLLVVTAWARLTSPLVLGDGDDQAKKARYIHKGLAEKVLSIFTNAKVIKEYDQQKRRARAHDSNINVASTLKHMVSCVEELEALHLNGRLNDSPSLQILLTDWRKIIEVETAQRAQEEKERNK